MKKTKYILVLTACAILLGIVIMLVTMKKTDSGTCGEKLTWVLDKDGTLTISGEGEMYDWSTSNSPWYSNFGNRSIKEVVIDNGVTSIGGFAFDTCSALTTITIPDSVTSIGEGAFSWCKALTTIKVSENNASYTDIDGVLFTKDAATILAYPAGKTEETYVIPDSVTSIGYHAFSYCVSLTAITIPDSVTSIESGAFSGCKHLTPITIPNSVTSIGNRAFEYCYALTTITIQNPECEIYDHRNTISDTATIHSYANSTAQAYAKKYGRNFEVIG